jgi:mono/diheme cytochrome c family protein
MPKESKIALALFCALAPATMVAQTAKSVWSGVFTAGQATRGEAVYGAKCAKCHEGADVDGPPLTGDPFLDRWREDTLSSLFGFIKEKMPQDNSGKLAQKEYVDVLAYLLSANHIPPGGALDLTAEAMSSTLLVGQDGPKPLPANALVKAVGCLVQGENPAWTLARAGDLARVRTADETTAVELAESTGKPLGTQIFELPNLAELAPVFSADANQGHKVMVKGVLARRGNATRINVLSAGSIAGDCKP